MSIFAPNNIKIKRNVMKKLLLMAFAACTFTACNNSGKQTEEINDSTTPLHLLKPNTKCLTAN